MITINNVSKIYNKNKKTETIAIDNLSLKIYDGSIVGLIGPNGAGKSTLIKMILGIMYPTQGEISINNLNSFKHRKKLMKNIGIVFGQRSQLWWDLTPIDSYNLIQKMYDVDKKSFEKTLGEMVDALDVKDIIHKPVRYLSLGQRMKCELIAALCFLPKIVILDEPTIGLDISAKDSIRNFLKQLNIKHGVTIILATHDLSDVEAICERVIMINHGNILFDGDSKSLINANSNIKKIEITCLDCVCETEIPFECEVERLGNKSILKTSGNSSDIIYAINWCFKECNIEDVSITKHGIEEVLMDWYK